MNRIVPIFADSVEAKGLYSLQYDGYPFDELERFSRFVIEPQHIANMVKSKIDLLRNQPFRLTQMQAQFQIYQEAEELIDLLSNRESKDLDSFLDQIHPFLDNFSNRYQDDVRKKLKASIQTPLVRVYAFEVSNRLWIITGFGFKFTRTIQEDPVLERERHRLNQLRTFFKSKPPLAFRNQTVDLPGLFIKH